jgi:hypothetical protein
VFPVGFVPNNPPDCILAFGNRDGLVLTPVFKPPSLLPAPIPENRAPIGLVSVTPSCLLRFIRGAFGLGPPNKLLLLCPPLKKLPVLFPVKGFNFSSSDLVFKGLANFKYIYLQVAGIYYSMIVLDLYYFDLTFKL